VIDEDGAEYVDYVMGWGALLFGHAWRDAREAMARVQARGVGCGVPHRAEVEYAERLVALLAWPEQVRLTNSGTEAVMTAVRIARSATGRPGIVKFSGGYHGHADSLLVAETDRGPGGASVDRGVPAGVAGDVWLAPYNSLGAVDRLLSANGRAIAAVVVEPVAANMGVVLPGAGFLAGLRTLCTHHGALLVFDEVVTGLRLAAGGAAECFSVVPDLAAFGKAIGGGLPVGAIAGPADLMQRLAPAGPVAHAGTFAGHPLTVAAGLAVIDAIAGDPGLYARLEAAGAALQTGITHAIARLGHPCTFARAGSMWTVFFARERVRDFATAQASSRTRYSRFFHALLRSGIHLAPSALEANFISAAHSMADISDTVAAAADALEDAHEHNR
jgi:glutamate-1-semialdehyde 2,1-aminomutase